MKTVSFDLKLDVGNTCYVIADGKIRKCVVQKIIVNYEKEAYGGSEYLRKEYVLVHADSSCGVLPNGCFNESEIWATKEELIKHIDEL